MTEPSTTRRSYGSGVVIVVFSLSGVWHLVSAESFLWLMPPFVPFPLVLVYLSGIAELLCAVGLLMRWGIAPALTVATLLAVWVANWWYALDVTGTESWWLVALAWLRVPGQLPLLWWAWRSPGNRWRGPEGA